MKKLSRDDVCLAQVRLENTGSEQHYRVTEPDERTRLTKERQCRHWVVPGRPGNVQISHFQAGFDREYPKVTFHPSDA